MGSSRLEDVMEWMLVGSQLNVQPGLILQHKVWESGVIVHLSSATLDVSSSQALERCVSQTPQVLK